MAVNGLRMGIWETGMGNVFLGRNGAGYIAG
jgi:hypothetical protein